MKKKYILDKIDEPGSDLDCHSLDLILHWSGRIPG